MRISDWSSDVCSSDLIVITDLPKHSAATSGVAQLSASRIASRSSGPTQLRRKVHLRANVIGTGAINDRGATVVVSVFEVAVAAGFVLVGELFKPVGDRLSVGHDDLLMQRGSLV